MRISAGNRWTAVGEAQSRFVLAEVQERKQGQEVCPPLVAAHKLVICEDRRSSQNRTKRRRENRGNRKKDSNRMEQGSRIICQQRNWTTRTTTLLSGDRAKPPNVQ